MYFALLRKGDRSKSDAFFGDLFPISLPLDDPRRDCSVDTGHKTLTKSF